MQTVPNPQIVVLVWIGKYTSEKCLLSDRGFSNSINLPYVDSIDFNLRHDAFIRYVFRPRRMVLQRVPAHVIDAMPKLFNVYYSVDDMDHLRTYNWATSSLKCNTSPPVRCCDGRRKQVQATQA